MDESDGEEEFKFEKISHVTANAIQKARLVKDLSQAQLAKAINEKTGVVVEIENGTARYNAD